jgi:hypothetical protein
LRRLVAAHAAGQLTFYGAHAALVDVTAFATYLAPLRRSRFVYAKRPFAGPKAVLACLTRYTHRVAISNGPSSETLNTPAYLFGARMSPSAGSGHGRRESTDEPSGWTPLRAPCLGGPQGLR